MSKTVLVFEWQRFGAFALEHGFRLNDYSLISDGSISVNELDIINELVDRLLIDARIYGTGRVTGYPVGWGSPQGGIKVSFEQSDQAMLWKLSWK